MVPDVNGINQTLYVGVYSTNSGSPSINGIFYDRFALTLTCTSSGGPATTVSWKKNGAIVDLQVNGTTYHQSKTVVNTTTATYENTLSSIDAANLVGIFTCMVINSRGSSTESMITLNGEV